MTKQALGCYANGAFSETTESALFCPAPKMIKAPLFEGAFLVSKTQEGLNSNSNYSSAIIKILATSTCQSRIGARGGDSFSEPVGICPGKDALKIYKVFLPGIYLN